MRARQSLIQRVLPGILCLAACFHCVALRPAGSSRRRREPASRPEGSSRRRRAAHHRMGHHRSRVSSPRPFMMPAPGSPLASEISTAMTPKSPASPAASISISMSTLSVAATKEPLIESSACWVPDASAERLSQQRWRFAPVFIACRPPRLSHAPSAAS